MAIIMHIAPVVRVVDIDVYRVNDLIILAADESPEVRSFRRREHPVVMYGCETWTVKKAER